MEIKRSNRKTKLSLIMLAVIVLVAGIIFYFKNSNESEYAVNDQGQYVVDEPSNSGTKENYESTKQATDNSSVKPNKDTNTSITTAELSTPSGNFVSSHNVQSNSNMESICITTPGAKCSINFNSGSTSKTLNEKTANSEGVVSWYWQPSKIGINGGKWTITATATLNGATKQDSDPMKLEVSK